MRQFFLLLLVLRRFSGLIVLSILLGIATISAGIGLLGTSAYLIASAALHPSIAELQVAIVGVRFFGISRGVFRYLERLVSHNINLHMMASLREDFYKRLEPGAPANIQSRQGGEILDRLMSDLQTLESFYVRVFSPMVVAVVVSLGMFTYTGSFAWQVGLILAAGMFLQGFFLPAVTLLLTRKDINSLTKTRSGYAAHTLEFLQGMEDLQAHNVHIRWAERVLKLGTKIGYLQRRLSLANGFSSSTSLLLLNVTVLGILWWVIPQVNSGTFSGVTMAVLILLAMAAFEATQSLPAAAYHLNTSLEASKRFFEMLPTGRVTSVPHKMLSPLSGNEIIFEKVSFSHNSIDEPVLQDINFSFRKGDKIAIVGASGAGKTTLVNLLLGFHHPTSGRIIIDGVDSTMLTREDLCTMFDVIDQSPYLFNTTLRDNLLIADEEASDMDLTGVLAEVRLEEWTASLPKGLGTWVGEHGVHLSAGEGQRVALARVLLRDCPYVILDEPTNNLDLVNESQVISHLFDVFHDRGILLVTHRLELLPLVENIIVLEEGRIVESGSLQKLTSFKGSLNSMQIASRNRVKALD